MSKTGEWNLSGLYSGLNDSVIERDLLEAEQRVAEFAAKWSGKTDCLSDPNTLLEALSDYEALNRNVGTGNRPNYFAILASAMDAGDPDLKKLSKSIENRMIEMDKLLIFFELAIGRIDADAQKLMLTSTELQPYHVWLKRRFDNASHDLSDEVEKALSDILPQARDAWVSLTSTTLSNAKARMQIDGTWKLVPFNELSSYMTSTDSDLVQRANCAHTWIAGKYATGAENEINAVITTNIRLSRLQNYSRVDEASFARNGLTADIVESMLSTVEANYDVAHQYYDLKARLFGRNKIHYYERAMSYGSLPSGYSFEHAVTVLREVLTKLHPDFVVEFDKALAAGQIDHLPRPGKRGGAACWSDLIEFPSFLMLNYTGQLNDVQTLAHEFGHFLNNIHMQSGGRCDGLTYGAPISLAEVASTFFEKYVLDAIIADADEQTRLAILVSTVSGDVSTIFRQTAATRFEQALYAEIEDKRYLSKQEIGELFTGHMANYMGTAVIMDAGANHGWIHWTHFRRGFYNYSYVFAQLVSSALQDKVDADPAYIGEFRRLLETGRSQSTPDLLHSLQLNASDGSLWQPGLDKIRSNLTEATQLAAKLGKI